MLTCGLGQRDRHAARTADRPGPKRRLLQGETEEDLFKMAHLGVSSHDCVSALPNMVLICLGATGANVQQFRRRRPGYRPANVLILPQGLETSEILSLPDQHLSHNHGGGHGCRRAGVLVDLGWPAQRPKMASHGVCRCKLLFLSTVLPFQYSPAML